MPTIGSTTRKGDLTERTATDLDESPGLATSATCLMGEIWCRFIFSGKNDEPTPDFHRGYGRGRAR